MELQEIKNTTHKDSSGITIHTLRNGLANNEFSVVYQPQINTKDNKLFGLEALVRWKREGYGYVSPGEFIPLAEESGVIHSIGYRVLDEAIRSASEWLQAGYDFGQISVNVSAVELSDQRYIHNLLVLCDKYDFPHELLELEVTEGVSVERVESGIETLNEISKLGFKIAIDDFGVGHSNLFSIITLNFHTLKIDRKMIEVIGNPRAQYILSTIVEYGKEHKINILAEGVETKEQNDAVIQLGCRLIQGYYYSKPKTAAELESVLKHKYKE